VQLNKTTVGVFVGGLAVLVAGAFVLGKNQTTTGEPKQATAPEIAVQVLPLGSPDLPNEGRLGLAKSPAKFAHFRVGNKNVKSMYVEGSVVWVGTSGGVVRYDTKTDAYRVFDNRNGLLSNGIFYVGRIKGQLTVGTYGGGMSMLNEQTGQWKHYNIPEGMGDAFIYDVVEMKNGDIWIATWSGANRIRGGALDDRSKWDLFTVENTNGGLPNDWVYGLAEGKDGILWLATEGGMARFEKDKWENWNHAKGIGTPYEKVKDSVDFKNDPGQASVHHAKQKQEMGLQNVNVAFNPNYIVALEVARDGTVWAGTWGGGLTVWDGQKWTNYSSIEGLPGNHVFMLHQDGKGQMWIGTNRGLALWQGGKFKTMTTADGLFDNNIFSMATQADGGMWIGSYGGVAFIKAKN
jgi:ligand-binding sensor domain-containing protein